MGAAIVLGVALVATTVGLVVYSGGLRSDRAAAERRAEQVLDDNAALRATNAELTEDIAGLRREVRDLVRILRSVRGEREDLRREMAELRAELEDASTTVAECGDIVELGAGVSQVSAENVDCTTALAVARAWQENCFFRQCDENEPLDGFICRSDTLAPELVHVECTAPGDQVVRFEAGA